MNDYILYGLGLVAAISSALTALVANRRTGAAMATMEETLTKLSKRVAELEDERTADYEAIKLLRFDLDVSQAETKLLKNETRLLKRGVLRLVDQIRKARLEPVWTPEMDGIPGNPED